MDQFVNFPDCIISKIIQFRKLANFQILKICKTIEIPKTLNLANYHICFWLFVEFKKT